MSTPAASISMSPELQGWRAVGKDWLQNEGQRWVFVIKTLIAAFLALWIAFRMGFDSPRSAMMTVFIVALPSSGMALEKGVYRLLGTLVGCAAALAIVGLFPQQPMLLFIALAIWVGLCTSGAALMRNARSYGFVLAGYTACMIALPAIDMPMGVFNLAVARVTEISLGILCSALLNDALFPKHQSEQLVQTVRGLYLNFAQLCHDALHGTMSDEQMERQHLRFATDVAALEANRAASLFEAGDVRTRSQQLHAFNAAAMVALTTFHTLHRLMQRLRQRGDLRVPGLMAPLFDAFSAALLVDGTPARTAAEAGLTREKFAQLQRELPILTAAIRREFEEQREQQPISPQQQLDLDTALELLQRFQQEFMRLITVYHELPMRLTDRPQRADRTIANWSYSAKTPGMIAFVSGLRTAAALLILALAWYGLNWPSAAGAVILTVVFCALASSSPFPEQMIRSTTQGFALAIPFAFVCAFMMLNHVEGYLMLVLSMAPFLAASIYATTWRRTAGIGTGFNLMFAQIIAPENMMRFNVANFFNDSIAQIVGLVLAVMMFALILPEHRQGSRRHIAQALWRETLRLCTSNRPQMREHFESRMRDLLNQLSMGMGGTTPAGRVTLNQAIVLLELGHAILDLRASGVQWASDHPVRAAQENCIAVLAAYFRQPLPIRHAQALAATTSTINAVRAYRKDHLIGIGEAAALQRGLTDLHLIGTSLQDPSLQAVVVESGLPKGSVDDAS
ncbi:MAG TPA: FUSC family protein [Oxalicibacterium sp.]|nr:FUSC family protein [Oxalicibacterium sp.]